MRFIVTDNAGENFWVRGSYAWRPIEMASVGDSLTSNEAEFQASEIVASGGYCKIQRIWSNRGKTYREKVAYVFSEV